MVEFGSASVPADTCWVVSSLKKEEFLSDGAIFMGRSSFVECASPCEQEELCPRAFPAAIVSVNRSNSELRMVLRKAKPSEKSHRRELASFALTRRLICKKENLNATLFFVAYKSREN